MKKPILVAIATLPFLGTLHFAEPAAADIIIKLPLSGNRSRPPAKVRKRSYPVSQNRERRKWIPGQWQDRRGNRGSIRRVWVPGHYVVR